MSPVLNFMMVSGPNGAGKTVYLKQVALIIIMAQIGCFVPCEGAKIPLRDRILSRMGTTDDLENNLSTFMTEMKDNAYIVDFLTKKSLCIVDELGRGTSNLDGLGIALSVAEYLATTPAFTLFVTHYPQLQLLEKMYPGVRNVYLEAQIDIGSPSAGSLHTIHRLKAGTREVSHGYGIAMASQVNFPSRVIDNARELQVTVLRLFPQLEESQKVDTSARTVIQAIAALNGTPTLTADESLRVYLAEIRGRLNSEVSASLLKLVDEMDELDKLEGIITNSGAKRAAGSGGTSELQQKGPHQTRPSQDKEGEAGREEPLTKRKTT
jgi:DNA mismatch repair ATPase MutS